MSIHKKLIINSKGKILLIKENVCSSNASYIKIDLSAPRNYYSCDSLLPTKQCQADLKDY